MSAPDVDGTLGSPVCFGRIVVGPQTGSQGAWIRFLCEDGRPPCPVIEGSAAADLHVPTDYLHLYRSCHLDADGGFDGDSTPNHVLAHSC